MAFISDILLVAGALGAAVYCMILSRRLRRFNDLENGVGGAIAVLSAQVDDMTRALEGARTTASSSSSTLLDLTGRAEGVAQRLELLVASLHDLPLAEDVAPGPAKSSQTRTPPPDPSANSNPEQPSPAGLSFVRSSRSAGIHRNDSPLVLHNSPEAAE